MNNGNQVTFVCCGGGDDARMKFVRLKKYKRTGSTKKDLIWDFFYSIKVLWKCPKTDILLCNTFWTPALAPLFRWKYRRLVYGVHRYPKGQFWLYPFVHAFICVSTAVADELRRQLGEDRNVQTINNPVDVKMPMVRGANNGNYMIVYAGRVHQEKGLDILFKAAELLAGKGMKVKLKIIGTTDCAKGGGGEAYVRHLSAIAPNVDVVWVDAIADAATLALEMQTGDCFAYPSVADKGETFGVAPLEAMALGMPVVLSDLPCFGDFARPGENSLQFRRGTGAAARLADEVEYLISNPHESRRIAENAMRTASGFSKEKIALLYLRSFKAVLGGGCNAT